MSRRIYDTFMFRDEVDMLECRLTELEDIPDLYHIIVEADRTHGGNKPREYVYPDHKDRFSAWADRIVYVQASDLPDDVDAWSREHAQREWVWAGLDRLVVDPDDVVLHGDLDEIPTDLAARYVNPKGFVRFHQLLYSFAIDWLHPGSIANPPTEWWGTVAGRVRDIKRFADMRTARCYLTPEIPSAGWHLSWLGGHEAAVAKMDSFCHPEVRELLDRKHGSAVEHLADCYSEGWHTDGVKLLPVDVDDTWPRWISEGHAPASWFRPRDAAPPVSGGR